MIAFLLHGILIQLPSGAKVGGVLRSAEHHYDLKLQEVGVNLKKCLIDCKV